MCGSTAAMNGGSAGHDERYAAFDAAVGSHTADRNRLVAQMSAILDDGSPHKEGNDDQAAGPYRAGQRAH
jgi:hypothetical protein